ncbi:Tat proofreading chaperone DmsD [Caviibacterium pharyngocola]|uniref:Probable Tat proofreading chaperone DmsD n=1 Tax=Caviibacterium pharyngocola TaxID=28159 RepID=A0A2M8RUB7_9PAST|nr:Tat proofreading chaperone DmsD [Caviibacterium pharyngocola]PJG82455.1 Tat proofreading chaperone DmsD [Caviibacterium pharyngocola]
MHSELMQWISTGGRILGSLFYYEPTSAQAKSALAFFQQPDWALQWGNVENPQTITFIQQGLQQDLSAQYQALFIGPNALPAPPWGSVYLDPEAVIFGNSLLDLRDFLARHQIAFSASQQEPEDHFGLMLMLSAYLAENKQELLSEFLSRHFLIWSGRYLELLTAQSDYPFYQGLGLLARQTLREWQEELALIVPKAQFYR